ncbi:MAG TPA: outer membrane protein assembly factor BamB [Rhodocyclaceae bacterium]|nr:outer membrane protein assembly factor BamB [Rhodocyclaceae bacterium]
MKRLAVLALMAVLAGCSTVSETVDKLNPFSASAPKVKPTELTPITASANAAVSWQAGVGAGGEFVFTPAVVGDSVYAAARDGSIARYDGGKQAWRVSAGQVLSGGVGSDGKTVVVGTPKGEVLAFDAANGNALWVARTSSEVLAAPAVGGGLVVVRSGDARIFGFEAGDGKRRWVYQRTTPALALRTNVGVVLAEDVVVAGFPGGKLVVISVKNGAAVWEVTVAVPKGATELERVADLTSLPVVDGRDICAVAFQGRIACFDVGSGNATWSREVSSSSGLDMDSRYVYVSDDKGVVQAFDRHNGSSVWKQDKLLNRQLSRPLAFGNYVVVADYQGVVHILNRDDGAFAARQATDGSAVTADPRRYGSGFLVQTRNGGLYAITAN